MINDLLLQTPAETSPADVCIIGAGAAGILLAVELARAGKRIVVLEGGGPDVEDASQDAYRSEVSGLRHNGIHEGRFRSLGGSTTRWGGQILELDPIDFEHRSWISGSGWPLPKDALTPYYARAIDLEGLGQATLDDDAVWREIGMASPHFANFETFFSRWCPETNFARLHGAALRDDPHIDVWLHANAASPVMQDGRVRGIVAKTLTGKSHTFAAHSFVWCMGGIESSRFFLQPELNGMPWHRSGLLGKHFQDHLIASAATLQVTDRKRLLDAFANVFSRGYKYHPKIRLSPAEQEKYGTLNVAALIFFQTESANAEAELKSTAKKLLRGKFSEVTGSDLSFFVRNAPLLARQSWAYTVKHRAYVPPDARIELGIHCEQPPETTSSIQLSSERDELGMFRTRLEWNISDLELHSIRTCVGVATDALKDIAHVVPDPDLATEKFRYKCGDGYHHMGGMRMAASPQDGVVDLNLKLHGIENGYVCSSAVFPCSGFSNPTHTVLALAVRLADHLATQ